MPASVAQSNGHLTGDQEVPGKIPAKNILSWRLIMKYFLLSLCPSADQEGQFLAKIVHKYWFIA